jgi:hypothetical protein
MISTRSLAFALRLPVLPCLSAPSVQGTNREVSSLYRNREIRTTASVLHRMQQHATIAPGESCLGGSAIDAISASAFCSRLILLARQLPWSTSQAPLMWRIFARSRRRSSVTYQLLRIPSRSTSSPERSPSATTDHSVQSHTTPTYHFEDDLTTVPLARLPQTFNLTLLVKVDLVILV